MADITFYWDSQNNKRVSASGAVLADSPIIAYQRVFTAQFIVGTWSNGTKTATNLTASATFASASGSDHNELTEPCTRTLNDNIDSTAKATGVIDVIIDANTSTLNTALGNNESISGWIELCGFDADSKENFYCKFPVMFQNKLDPSGGVPPSPVGNYPTWNELLALLADVQPVESFSASVSLKTAQSNVIFIVPAGKLFRPTHTEIITLAITGPATLPTFHFLAGATSLFTARLSENTGTVYGADIDELAGVTYYPAGTVFYMEITVAGTSTTHTGKALIKGVMANA